jgi:hypothetical protein
VQTGKKDAVEATLRLCLQELMEQLSALQLKQGSTDEIVKKLQQLLHKGVTS